MDIFEHVVINQAVVLSDVSSYVNINTLFGVVVVLAVLILIALAYLISILSYLKKDSADSTVIKSTSGDNAIAPIAGTVQEDLIGNHELVAVITAAIYASMGGDVPADGLVVRSIRKVNK